MERQPITRIRKKIKNSAALSGFEPPIGGTDDERQTVKAFANIEEANRINTFFLKSLEQVEVNSISPTERGLQEPIILDGSSSDPRLRKDDLPPSPLTPQEVAASLSPYVDKETGMSKIPRQRDLYPWEGVLYQ